jgi:tRNA threonylcarbamoyl adenosine modification protein (Sua5/YciO/YrdC/YwlC family)
VSATPVEEAVAAARGGALIVLPTDTVYGVAAWPGDPEATARVFAAKGRPPDLTLPVLVASTEAAREVGRFDERAEALAAACWPGALTIVLERTEGTAAWELGGDAATVGVRVPDHLLARSVLERAGPLAVTSANRSGEPPARTCDQLVAVFGDAVAVYLCEDEPLAGLASTVVDLAHGPARILRAGSVTAEEIASFLPGEPSLLDSAPP